MNYLAISGDEKEEAVQGLLQSSRFQVFLCSSGSRTHDVLVQV